MKRSQPIKYLLQSLPLWQPPTGLGVVEADAEWSVLFSQFEDARGCMHTLQQDAVAQYCDEHLMDTPMADESMLIWRFLIREVLFDDDKDSLEIDLEAYRAHEHKRRAWCYNVEDTLLWTLPDPAADQSDYDRFMFSGKFYRGDIVRILPQALEPNSPSRKGDFGVVAEVPIDKETWLRSNQAPEQWNGRYRVQYVDAFGFLNAYQLPECCLESLSGALPRTVSFIPIWALFLQGKARFPEGLADRIRARKVHLLDIPRYRGSA